MRLRKLIGALSLLLFVLLYMAVAMVLTQTLLLDGPLWAQILFYAVLGLGWVFPAGLIIKWSHKIQLPR